MNRADEVWNRACQDRGDGAGDRHLRALILVDGMLQNGGPNHAADSCTPGELAAAAAACEYFGLTELAGFVRRVPEAASGDAESDEDVEDRMSDEYFELSHDGEAIQEAFQARYAAAPRDFDPVTA